MTEMWKRKQNKLFLGGAAIFLFVLGMFVGGFLNDFAGKNRADEGDMDEVLEEDIASGEPHSVYDNGALCEVLKETLEDGEWIAETCDSFFVAEYFAFDYNGDGKMDYLVSLDGAGYDKRSG